MSLSRRRNHSGRDGPNETEKFTQPVELCDESGQVLGWFLSSINPIECADLQQ